MNGHCEEAEDAQPELDGEQLVLAKRASGEYHIVPGDVLQIQVPSLAKAAAVTKRPPPLEGRLEMAWNGWPPTGRTSSPSSKWR